MLLNASEIFNPNAQARTILLAIEDVTDRKQAEEQLRTTNAELQHFAYALTHDLQEPIRMVVNFTQLLARECGGKLGGEADQFIAYSVEGALRIETLLKALLAYWEVTGRGQDSFASVDCGAVLAKALLNLEAAIAESGAMVTSDPLPTVVAEEVMLIQLFQNLISNSIKFRGGETPRIHISAERDGEGWLFACLNACMEAKSPVRALVWRFAERSWSARVGGSGWNRKPGAALRSNSQSPSGNRPRRAE
jgi:light-regulated signal transduction histidine kinase (bacteriophytochrome)